MKCILFANGDYGQDLKPYRKMIAPDDLIICADGGANYAKLMKITPLCIIGDMDSITIETEEYFKKLKVQFRKFPRRKDFTDTQLAIAMAEERQVKEIVFFGTLGRRLDHTMANIYAGLDVVKRGVKLTHYSPEMLLHIVRDQLELKGGEGETVSVFALTDEAVGVSETGFEYDIENAVLKKDNPIGVSNRILSNQAIIKVENGVLAVFHYLYNSLL